jgi:hypothetical protein
MLPVFSPPKLPPRGPFLHPSRQQQHLVVGIVLSRAGLGVVWESVVVVVACNVDQHKSTAGVKAGPLTVKQRYQHTCLMHAVD